MPRLRGRTRLIALLTLTVAVMSTGVVTTTAAAEPTRTLRAAGLGEGDRGRAALARVAGRLPAVAKRNGMTRDRLARVLSTDQSAYLDRSDRLFYVEPVATPAQVRADSPQLAEVRRRVGAKPTGAAASRLSLHSKPGADRVIYLGFAGGTVSGTEWNRQAGARSAYIAPYDTDGNPAHWSAAEGAVVQSVFNQVSEDYAPFDVDVTTQAPSPEALRRSSASDVQYGVTIMVSNEDFFYADCGCGGVAYVGTFDVLDGRDTDGLRLGWVFTQGVGKGAKNIAEAASHEAGHTLGLSHDGTAARSYYDGQGSWAPIMGVGYGKPVSQFSKGEYAGASQRQDDFAVMASTGVRLRADDHSDSIATTTTRLDLAKAANGVITMAADADYFTVGLPAGRAVVTVQVAGTSPDLDASVSLYTSAGALVGAADPHVRTVSNTLASGMSATLTTAWLPAGTYYVQVDGVGSGSVLTTGYTDYGSVGRYTVKVTR